MPLETGARLGAYEIVGPLGAGGMGEVYRARDTRLDRTVALKILPPRFAERADVRERFQREAQVVSSLNHPNICTLYDVGQQDGTAYFVMEYLEGQSLADRIAKGPLPLDQTLRYAIDIADALAKAHQHGVVHRDLKPGNVMLTRSGAKLLDFGLARRENTGVVAMPDAPTVHGPAPLTAEGTILGTLQYMSPEQLEGTQVDARSDIFAFGAVLYEMVSGRRAFEATSHASLIAKIVGEEPRPLRELQPVTPPALERLIHRCLRKDPDTRWQCAGDLVAELRAIATAPEVDAPSAPGRRAVVPWTIAAVLAVLAVTLGTLLMLRPKQREQAVQFAMLPPPGSAFTFPPTGASLAVSPDGEQVAYIVAKANNRQLWIRPIGSTTSKLIESAEGASNPFWSPDGKSIAFFSAGKLQSVDLAGGTTQTICTIPLGAHSMNGAWAPDGTIVMTRLQKDGWLSTVPAAGGTPKPLPNGSGLLGAHFPRFFGDGKLYLFTGIEKPTPSLWVGSLDGTPPRRIASDISHVGYVPGWLVYTRDGVVVAQRFDEDALKLVGTPVPIVRDVQNYSPLGSAAYAVGGRTLVALTNPKPPRLLWIDRSGATISEAAASADYNNIRLSPDGRKLAAAIVDRRTGVGSLWTIDRARKTSTRISFRKTDHEWPVWSPDGKQIAYASDVDGPPHIYRQPSTSGDAVRVLPITDVQTPYDWTEDGIFYSDGGNDTQSDIFSVAASGGKPLVWLRTPADEGQPRVSPDRKWMAFISNQSGTREVYVAPMDDATAAVQVSSGGGESPRWTRGGAELIYRRGAREVMAAGIRNGIADEPKLLFTTRGDIKDFDVTADGSRFAIIHIDADEQAQPLTVVVNWQSGL